MVLDYTDGNQQWAADELGCSASTVWRMVNGTAGKPQIKRRGVAA